MRALALLVPLAGCAVAPPPPALDAATPIAPALAPAPAPAEIRITEARLEQGGFARGRVRPANAVLTLDGAPVPVAADGGFFIAFGRDAAAAVKLGAHAAAGGTSLGFSLPLAIRPRSFPEERLPPINRRFEADPDFAARRAEEVARIGAARAASSSETGWRQAFVMPAAGRISGVFGSRRIFGDSVQDPHSGTDIAAPEGAPVLAPADGVVVIASPPEFSLEGKLVIVDHGLGLYSSFLHLSRVDVAVGDRLRQGDSIGAVGASGRVTGAHLHWGVIWRGVRFDAEALVRRPGTDSVPAK